MKKNNLDIVDLRKTIKSSDVPAEKKLELADTPNEKYLKLDVDQIQSLDDIKIIFKALDIGFKESIVHNNDKLSKLVKP